MQRMFSNRCLQRMRIYVYSKQSSSEDEGQIQNGSQDYRFSGLVAGKTKS